MSILNSVITRIFGDPSERRVSEYRRIVEQIKVVEADFAQRYTTIEAVQEKTREFRARFAVVAADDPEYAEKSKKLLEEIKIEAFALHRTACRIIYGQEFTVGDHTITWNMIPYDVQLLGALALHDGNIAEMRTGEGKTLVATIAAYLNALAGIPVHIVTVNDYLAVRDSSEMGIIYGALGLTVGVVTHNQSPTQKKEQYARDIVYATNNELGFDYLRDNLAVSREGRVLGRLSYAIIDEVDSILIDEARTPLIISAPESEPTTKYVKFAQLARQLSQGTHYTIDEKHKAVSLNEAGIGEIECMLGIDNIYVSAHYNDIHHIENALKGANVYLRDIDYIVRNDEILIIDEHTGRVLSGRRYSDGLHQALEAKEGVTIQQESRTLASITFQNLFRLYGKLSGMTGTAKTEEEEFYKIYSLEVIVIPTNMPMIRDDRSDFLFKNEAGKFLFLVKLIAECHRIGQPVLVGTVSVAKSEYLSGLLEAAQIPHHVLNAKQDAREAEIISQAGRLGAITIATNMAGRGTDIKVDEAVRTLSGTMTVHGHTFRAGGLYVIGTEKHETRRIDNQLRGRSGRQGDPGLSQFLVSPQDDIMRIFGGEKLFSIFNAPMFASIASDEPLIESRMLTRRIDSIQKQVEGRNFDTRKHVLEYDDVLNNHRLVIYSRRNRILENEDIHEDVMEILRAQIRAFVEGLFLDVDIADWDFERLRTGFHEFTGKTFIESVETFNTVRTIDDVVEILLGYVDAHTDTARATFGDERFFDYEKRLALQSYDELWMKHLDTMSHLKEEVAFEGYAQKHPLIVYKERAYEKFVDLLHEIGFKIAKGMFGAAPHQTVDEVDLTKEPLTVRFEEAKALPMGGGNVSGDMGMFGIFPTMTPEMPAQDSSVRVVQANTKPEVNSAYQNINRNDPCPCGSGKKAKRCCLAA